MYIKNSIFSSPRKFSKTAVKLKVKRNGHVCWDTDEGVYLIGGKNTEYRVQR